MSVRVTTKGESTLYDSTTGQAFGPVFASDLEAEEFLEFCDAEGVRDIRRISEQEFDRLYGEFVAKQNTNQPLHNLRVVE